MRVAACILNESSVHRDSDLAVYTNNNVAVRHFPLVMNHFDAHFSTLQRNYITIFNYTEYTFDIEIFDSQDSWTLTRFVSMHHLSPAPPTSAQEERKGGEGEEIFRYIPTDDPQPPPGMHPGRVQPACQSSTGV